MVFTLFSEMGLSLYLSQGDVFMVQRFFRSHFGLLVNPIRLKWVPIWHPLPLSLYLRHGFCSEYEDVAANRVKQQFKITKQVYISLFVIGC